MSLRVVSLLPAATELVCAVGAGDQLVGVSHECDYPADAVAGLPRLTRSRVGDPGSGAAIDADVRAVLEQALSVFEVDARALADVQPDVIVTQDLCDVCALPRSAVQEALASFGGDGVTLVSCSPTKLEHVRDDLRRVGAALSRDAEAEAALAAWDARVQHVRELVDGAPRRRVLTLEWFEPAMVGGTWMPELVELAGGETLVTKAGEHAPTLTREELGALDPAPDVVLAKPCGFALARARDELPALRALVGGLPWPAVSEGEVWLADGNAFFNRPGPRLVESLEILAAVIHPERCGEFVTRHAEHVERVMGRSL